MSEDLSNINADLTTFPSSPVANTLHISESTTLAPLVINEHTSQHLSPLTVSPASLSPACIEYNLPSEAGLFNERPTTDANFSDVGDQQYTGALAISPSPEFVEGSSNTPLVETGPLVNTLSSPQTAQPRPSKRKRNESPSFNTSSTSSSSRSYPARSAVKKSRNYACDDSEYEEKKLRRQYPKKAPPRKKELVPKKFGRRNKICLTRENFEELKESNPHRSGACPYCDKYLQRSHEWLRHVETHIPQAIQCPACESPLSRRDALGRHLRNTCKGRARDASSGSVPTPEESDDDESDYTLHDETRKHARKKQCRR